MTQPSAPRKSVSEPKAEPMPPRKAARPVKAVKVVKATKAANGAKAAKAAQAAKAPKASNGSGPAKTAKAAKAPKAVKAVKALKPGELPPDLPDPGSAQRIEVRASGVHGKGVFAQQKLKKGEELIEYIGEIITWKQALKRHPHNPDDPNHTFYFHIDDGRVIDAAVGGNAARWINHACKPNCEADENDGRVFIKTLRKIESGEELFYDYGLVIDEPYTKKLKKQFECRCGAKKCRGTMLAPKESKEPKKSKKSKKAKKK